MIDWLLASRPPVPWYWSLLKVEVVGTPLLTITAFRGLPVTFEPKKPNSKSQNQRVEPGPLPQQRSIVFEVNHLSSCSDGCGLGSSQRPGSEGWGGGRRPHPVISPLASTTTSPQPPAQPHHPRTTPQPPSPHHHPSRPQASRRQPLSTPRYRVSNKRGGAMAKAADFKDKKLRHRLTSTHTRGRLAGIQSRGSKSCKSMRYHLRVNIVHGVSPRKDSDGAPLVCGGGRCRGCCLQSPPFFFLFLLLSFLYHVTRLSRSSDFSFGAFCLFSFTTSLIADGSG